MLDWVVQGQFGAFPTPSYDHCAVGLGKKVYIFGGNRNPGGSVPRLSHDLHVLDLDTGFWEQQRTSPMQPCARAGHNMVVSGSSLYIMCGWTWQDDDTLYLGDTFVYSTKDDLWSPIHAAGTPPVGRAHAAASYFREQIFLFGGCNGTTAASYRRDMMVLNLRTLNWTEMQPNSAPPSGRSQLGMCAYNGQLYVFGGHHLQAGKKKALGDLQVFDIKDRTWTLVSDSEVGKGPSARAWHSLIACNHGIFLFGGAGDASSPVPFFDALWVFNPVSLGWHNLSRRTALQNQDPSLLPNRPNARAGMAMATLTPASNSHLLFVLGGLGKAALSRLQSQQSGSTLSRLPSHAGAGERGSGDTTIMGDVFKVDVAKWHAQLPANELDAEFNQADFTGRALASIPRPLHAPQPLAGQLARSPGEGGEGMSPGGGRRSSSTVSSSTCSSSSSAPGPTPSLAPTSNAGGGGGSIVWELHAPKGLGPDGEAPSARSGHACVVLGRRMYVCGGLAEDNGQRQYLMDMFRLDLSSMLWSRLLVPDDKDGEIGYSPDGRAGHNVVAVEQGRSDLWLLFGWYVHKSQSYFLNDVHTYDPTKGTWTKREVGGEAPPPRAYAATAVYKTKILVFGGCNGTLASHFRNDIWALDVHLNTWTRVHVGAQDVLPAARAQHAMVHYGGMLYVFGGNNKRAGKRHVLADLYAFDLAQSKWRLLNDGIGGGEYGQNGEAPSKRSGHAMVLQNGGLFVFGGGGVEGGADGFYDSLWVFDTSARRWSLLTQEDEEGLVGSKRPCARAGHSMVAAGSQVLVFGGLCPSGGGQGGAVRPLADLASFISTGWRQAMPKFVSDRKREAATRLLAKLQGLDDHAASRLLDSVHAFRGAAREAYNKALENPYGDDDDEAEVAVDGKVVPLAHDISAQLSVLNQRIDSMLGRIAPERRDILQLQRQAQLAPIMAKGGVLEVTVHSGRDLPKMDRFGKSDPYCVIQADGQKHKTKILKKTLNPVWKEAFSFKVTDTGSRVVVSCFDWDFADAHDFMGQCVVKLDELLDGPLDQFMTLRDHEGKAMQGSLRLLLSYRPADTGVLDAKTAIAAALNTLSPEEQEELMGAPLAADAYRQGPRQAANLKVHLDAFEDIEEAVRKMPPVHDLALSEEMKQRALREAATVERRRQDNLAEIQRLRRDQLRDEDLEKKVRQLSLLEKLEEQQVAARRVEEEEVEVDTALKSTLRNIASVTKVLPVDPSIHWDEHPAAQLQECLDAEYKAMKDSASSPSRQPHPAPAERLKPHPPEQKKMGGARPLPQVAGGAMARQEVPGAGGGEGGAGGREGGASASGEEVGKGVSKSVLTTMFGKGVSVEAKKRLMVELRAKKRGEGEAADAFQVELKAMQEKMRQELEKEEIEKRRVEKEAALETQRRRVALQLAQEERGKAQMMEKRERLLAQQEEEEKQGAERLRVHNEEIEAKRVLRLAAEEERRRSDPESVARAKRLNQFVSTSTMRNLSSIKMSQEALKAAQHVEEEALSSEANARQAPALITAVTKLETTQRGTAAPVDPAERVKLSDDISQALSAARKHLT